MEERPRFRVELIRDRPETAVVALEGEVDIYTSPQLQEALLAGIEDGASILIVDLARVTFIDSAALGILVGSAKRVRPQNGRLDIVCTNENVCRLFEITGLDHIFNIYRTRDDALRVAASTADD